VPDSIKCLLNVQEHSCAYELFFKRKGDLIYKAVDLMYCGMILSKPELSIGKGFSMIGRRRLRISFSKIFEK